VSIPLNDPVCSNCGSDRLGAIQRGIDNWPVAQCFNCGPTTAFIPEDDGTWKGRRKRENAIRSASRKPIGSKKAIHTVLRPLVERSEYRPKVKPVEAPMLGMFET
jgi:hypothetical protein